MRRSDKEIKDPDELLSIIRKSTIMRLAITDEGSPYIVPLNFGYQDGSLFFHCAKKGLKLDIIKRNPKVCFEFESDVEILKSEKPCEWGMRYKSVIGFGKAQIIDVPEKKLKALQTIVEHCGGNPDGVSLAFAGSVTLVEIKISGMTGKSSGC